MTAVQLNFEISCLLLHQSAVVCPVHDHPVIQEVGLRILCASCPQSPPVPGGVQHLLAGGLGSRELWAVVDVVISAQL